MIDGGLAMPKVTYHIIEHDGGWAYRVGDVISETFPSHDLARKAAERAAGEQRVGGETTDISYEDSQGAGMTRCPRAGTAPTPMSRKSDRAVVGLRKIAGAPAFLLAPGRTFLLATRALAPAFRRGVKPWAFAVGHCAGPPRGGDKVRDIRAAFPTSGRLNVNSNPTAGAARDSGRLRRTNGFQLKPPRPRARISPRFSTRPTATTRPSRARSSRAGSSRSKRTWPSSTSA